MLVILCPQTICLSIQNAKVKKGHNSDKSKLKFNKILSGNLHTGSKLLAKCHEPNTSGSLDILLTRMDGQAQSNMPF